MLKQITYVWMVCGMVFLLCIEDAKAYIDPGTGSMLLQALLAGGVAALAFWSQLKSYFLKIFAGKNTDSTARDNSE